MGWTVTPVSSRGPVFGLKQEFGPHQEGCLIFNLRWTALRLICNSAALGDAVGGNEKGLTWRGHGEIQLPPVMLREPLLLTDRRLKVVLF